MTDEFKGDIIKKSDTIGEDGRINTEYTRAYEEHA